MFNIKKNSFAEFDSVQGGKSDTTIIGSSSHFEGKLNSKGIIRVDGSFSGELNIEGDVIIGEGGNVKGTMRASKVTIAGSVEANVHCDGNLELTSNGKLYGDIEVRAIRIEDGAIFQGRCTMINEPAPPALESGAEEDIKMIGDNSATLSK